MEMNDIERRERATWAAPEAHMQVHDSWWRFRGTLLAFFIAANSGDAIAVNICTSRWLDRMWLWRRKILTSLNMKNSREMKFLENVAILVAYCTAQWDLAGSEHQWGHQRISCDDWKSEVINIAISWMTGRQNSETAILARDVTSADSPHPLVNLLISEPVNRHKTKRKSNEILLMRLSAQLITLSSCPMTQSSRVLVKIESNKLEPVSLVLKMKISCRLLKNANESILIIHWARRKVCKYSARYSKNLTCGKFLFWAPKNTPERWSGGGRLMIFFVVVTSRAVHVNRTCIGASREQKLISAPTPLIFMSRFFRSFSMTVNWGETSAVSSANWHRFLASLSLRHPFSCFASRKARNFIFVALPATIFRAFCEYFCRVFLITRRASHCQGSIELDRAIHSKAQHVKFAEPVQRHCRQPWPCRQWKIRIASMSWKQIATHRRNCAHKLSSQNNIFVHFN